LQAAEAGERSVQLALQACGQTTQALQAAQHQLALLTQAAPATQDRQTALQKDITTTHSDLTALDARLQTDLADAGYTLPHDPATWLKERQADWQRWQSTQTQLHTVGQALTRQQTQTQAAQEQAQTWAQRWHALQANTALRTHEAPHATTHEGAYAAPDGASNDAPNDTNTTPIADAAIPAALATIAQAIDHLAQTLSECKGRQAQSHATLAQQTQALSAALHTWQTALEQSPFADQASFEAALLPEAERQHLAQRKATLVQAQQNAAAVLQAAQDKNALLIAQTPTQPTLEDTDAHLATLETQRQGHHEKIGAHRALLAQDAQLRSSQQTLLAQISHQAAESDLWQRLDGLIGSAKGDKFRKFAQGLTLDHLLQLANQHLNRLHGRYLLRHKLQGELELEIVDAWQGDVARDTRTLSGGEGFLVSLALALALSDLVSHKTSIDSLFLDEGFGTLDGDTLEIALSALDCLQANGKMIGIISHVEALKERISAQIKVVKGGGVGYSTLVV
jgi:exonuclease SbcC